MSRTITATKSLQFIKSVKTPHTMMQEFFFFFFLTKSNTNSDRTCCEASIIFCSKEQVVTPLPHIYKNSDRHCQQMDNDLKVLHSKRQKEQQRFQLSERKS